RTGWELFDLASSIATPRGKEASHTPEAAAARIAALREDAVPRGLPAEGDDTALVKSWTELFDAYVGRLRFAPEHRTRTKRWASFFLAKPVKFDALVATLRPKTELPEARVGLPSHARARDGFGLTDPRKTPREVTGEVHYCLICHEREKDSCSKGFPKK